MADVHESAARGYANNAAIYVRGRPDYPDDVVGWLRSVVQLRDGRSAVDLGAGTGKFAPFLRATGAAVTAVEPVAAMRAELERAHPGVRVLDGRADGIPLPDASVDAVVCAQAFHWFATGAALAEIHRVLRPDGMLALVWNGRDQSVDWVAQVSRITDAYEGDTPRYQTGRWRDAFDAGLFTLVDEQRFGNRHVGPVEQVVMDRTMSVSFIGKLPPEEQQKIRDELRALIDATPALNGGGPVAFPYVCSCYAYRKARAQLAENRPG